MNHPQSAIRNRVGRRIGFTLIELLVVIAIIGTLIGILIPAVMKARQTAYRTNTTIELAQLDAACKAFYAKYGFYPPSRINLQSNMASSDAQSQAIIARMFPRIKNGATWTTVNWGVTGTLSGDECLVFFLGGVNAGGAPGNTANPPNFKGFNQAPTNPGTTGGGAFDPPFFNFQTGRIVNGSNGHPAYQDYFKGKQYAFFSSTNGYLASDCSSLMSGGPYLSAVNAFIKPDSVQIISAGSDMAFGPGGVILTTGGGTALAGTARDDQASFAASGLSGY